MSQVEAEVKGALTALLLGEPTLLDQLDQRSIAHWVVMKVMVAEFARKENIVSTFDERNEFRTTRQIPEGWNIWIAKHAADDWYPARLQMNVATIGSSVLGVEFTPDRTMRKNTQSTTMGIGNLLVQVVSSRHPGLNLRFAEPELKEALVQLHPWVQPIAWPPARTLMKGEPDKAAGALKAHLSTWDWLPRV